MSEDEGEFKKRVQHDFDEFPKYDRFGIAVIRIGDVNTIIDEAAKEFPFTTFALLSAVAGAGRKDVTYCMQFEEAKALVDWVIKWFGHLEAIEDVEKEKTE